MFYISIHNHEPIEKLHSEHFKNIVFEGDSSNKFLCYLNRYRDEILVGDPNQYLKIIEMFYKCINEYMENLSIYQYLDFSTLWVIKIDYHDNIVSDVQFEIDWPRKLKSFRKSLLSHFNKSENINKTFYAYKDIPSILKSLVFKPNENINDIEDVKRYKKNGVDFWKRDSLIINASQLDSKFHSDLKEMYKLCNEKLNYQAFSVKGSDGWDAYKLCKSIAPRLCPYCNRNHTPVVMSEDKEFSRPEIDHFLPKSIYPMFAISLYNLIPSCHTCNHIKSNVNVVARNKDGEMNYQLCHPHLESDDICSTPIFSIKNTSDIVNQLVSYNTIPNVEITMIDDLDIKIINSLKLFNLSFDTGKIQNGFYHHHDKEICDSIRLLYQYPKSVLKQINTLLNTDHAIDSSGYYSLQRILFDKIAPNECKNTPLGKLKSDCLSGMLQHCNFGK
ncbi:conserved hypothetical protein [Vibrio owensii]|uniref:HNH nuclease domain-containing protein n=1 Tax=Vibrio owensii TaxID=696485 RepID=A0AAU9Q5C0_9VIBR|nr:conserved hypothetical protein [Vibrio owensii]